MERLEAVMTSPVCVEWDELKKLLNLNTYQKLICDS